MDDIICIQTFKNNWIPYAEDELDAEEGWSILLFLCMRSYSWIKSREVEMKRKSNLFAIKNTNAFKTCNTPAHIPSYYPHNLAAISVNNSIVHDTYHVEPWELERGLLPDNFIISNNCN